MAQCGSRMQRYLAFLGVCVPVRVCAKNWLSDQWTKNQPTYQPTNYLFAISWARWCVFVFVCVVDIEYFEDLGGSSRDL